MNDFLQLMLQVMVVIFFVWELYDSTHRFLAERNRGGKVWYGAWLVFSSLVFGIVIIVVWQITGLSQLGTEKGVSMATALLLGKVALALAVAGFLRYQTTKRYRLTFNDCYRFVYGPTEKQLAAHFTLMKANAAWIESEGRLRDPELGLYHWPNAEKGTTHADPGLGLVRPCLAAFPPRSLSHQSEKREAEASTAQ